MLFSQTSAELSHRQQLCSLVPPRLHDLAIRLHSFQLLSAFFSLDIALCMRPFPFDEDLGCFQFLTLINNTAVNILVHASLCN